jgi:hypothetical protein
MIFSLKIGEPKVIMAYIPPISLKIHAIPKRRSVRMKSALMALSALWIAVLPSYAQTAKKLRAVTAPGITENQQPKSWHNTLAVSGDNLVLTCPKCLPIQTVSVKKEEIDKLRYGQNAYHHWAAGIATGIFTLGVGAIIGFMPHHQHFFSVDLKNGKAVGIQADKGNYKEIAAMLGNFTGLPIHVTVKDAHLIQYIHRQQRQ